MDLFSTMEIGKHRKKQKRAEGCVKMSISKRWKESLFIMDYYNVVLISAYSKVILFIYIYILFSLLFHDSLS